jgi:hypothetical protein
MKRIMGIIIFLCFIPLHGEPLYDLLSKYVADYYNVSSECLDIANAIKILYPVTFFVLNIDEGIVTDVLGREEVRDTVINATETWIRNEGSKQDEVIRKYDYDRLTLLMDELSRMLRSSVPQASFDSKSFRVKENFLNSEVFMAKVKEFKYFLMTLVEIASVIKNTNPGFLGQYASLNHAGDLKYWPEWDSVMLEIEKMKIERSLRNFEIRYGENSEKINFLEFFVISQIRPFKGNEDGPSPWEPILRFTPVCYDFTDTRFVKTLQLGLNYYFFAKGILSSLHHIGVAFLITDIESEKIYELNKPAYGIQIHLGKYQIGLVKDSRDNSLKFISTVDFQLIPRLF